MARRRRCNAAVIGSCAEDSPFAALARRGAGFALRLPTGFFAAGFLVIFFAGFFAISRFPSVRLAVHHRVQ